MVTERRFQMPKTPSLDAAYRLNTPDDSLRLYRDWAPTYDRDFAAAQGYTYPSEVAKIFADRASLEDAPILDVGAGTGLVGERLYDHGLRSLEALDISQEMLDVAKSKTIYQQVHQIDLTAPGTFGLKRYGGLVSAGTFTHGHVGPDALASLISMGKSGALFVLGINSSHFEIGGFGRILSTLKSSIYAPEFLERPIYDGSGDADHAKDTALVAVFRKR